MKKINWLIAAATILVACGGQQNSKSASSTDTSATEETSVAETCTTTEISYEKAESSKTVAYQKKETAKNGISVQVEYSAEVPAMADPAIRMILEARMMAQYEKAQGADLEQVMQHAGEEYLRTTKKEVLDYDLEEPGFGVDIQGIARRTSIVHNQRGVLSMKTFVEWDEYGAMHPTSGESHTTFDLETGQELELKDLLSGKWESAMLKVARKWATQHKDELLILPEEIYITENFYITADGIMLSYTPYEIGPWASGQIEIAIPYSVFKDYVRAPYTRIWESNEPLTYTYTPHQGQEQLTLAGTIGKSRLTLNIEADGMQVTGTSYYGTKSSDPMHNHGYWTDRALTLLEVTPKGLVCGYFVGQMDGQTYSGEYTNLMKGSTMPFTLTVQ